ncbi:hypothetical protein ACP4OV_010802 [Aristida adscensionis]
MAAAASSTATRNPRQIRASRLAALTTKESCHGKSKFFIEHQAMKEKEGDTGYDTKVHGWRYAQQLPLPEGKWPPLSKFRGGARDEHDKQEAKKWHKEANRVRQEEARQRELLEQELRRQRQRLAADSGRCRNDDPPPMTIDESRHVSNVQMAVSSLNGENPDSKYELREITARSTIVDFGSTHCHYNFSAYSPADGLQLFFAEVDASFQSKRRVLQCCAISSGSHGIVAWGAGVKEFCLYILAATNILPGRKATAMIAIGAELLITNLS